MWKIPFTVWTQNYYGQGRMDDILKVSCDSREEAIECLNKHVAYNYPSGRLDFDEDDIKYEPDHDEFYWDWWENDEEDFAIHDEEYEDEYDED